MLKLYYENEHIRLHCDEELHLGVSEWKGFVSSDALHSTALHFLSFIQEHHITRWLSDRRKMRAVRQQDQQWAVEVFLPQLLESPLRRMATVVSEDIFNQMAMEQMLKRSGNLRGLTLRDFENVTDAMEWLKQPFEEERKTADGASTAE